MLVAGLAAAVLILVVPRLHRRLVAGACGLALVAGLAAPAAFSVATAATPHRWAAATFGA